MTTIVPGLFVTLILRTTLSKHFLELRMCVCVCVCVCVHAGVRGHAQLIPGIGNAYS